MKAAGIILAACVVLAAVQAMAAALAVLLLCCFVYGLFAHTKPTLGIVGLLTVAAVAQQQPLAFLGVIALALLTSKLRRIS